MAVLCWVLIVLISFTCIGWVCSDHSLWREGAGEVMHSSWRLVWDGEWNLIAFPQFRPILLCVNVANEMCTINRWVKALLFITSLFNPHLSLHSLPLPFSLSLSPLPLPFSPSPISLPPPPPPAGRHSVHESEGSRDYAGVAHLAPTRCMHLRWPGQWRTATLSEWEYSVPQIKRLFISLSLLLHVYNNLFILLKALYVNFFASHINLF